MLEMAMNSAKLFFAGKIFKDNKKVFQQLALAVLVGVVLIVALSQVAPLWIAAMIGGGVAGFLMPVLFKNLKYA